MNILMVKKNFFRLLFAGFLISNFSAYAQKTTIWVVRNAESTSSAQNADDPSLSADGLTRANILVKRFKRESVKAIFVTTLKRTIQTARPLAATTGITPLTYTGELKTFAAEVLKKYNGSSVLIIGYSDTVMPLLAAFGADTPFLNLAEDDYDMLFKITVKDSGAVSLDIFNYGKKHHSSELPQKYLDAHRVVQPIARPVTNF